MSIKAKIPQFLAMIESRKSWNSHNAKLNDILRGKLMPYVADALKKQLSGQALEQALHRVPPINTLQRIVDKQSKIYSQGVSRNVDDGNDTDKALLSWYEEKMRPTRKLTLANRYFNLFKGALISPYLKADGSPALRVEAPDRFIPYSVIPEEPETLGGVIKLLGESVNSKGQCVQLYEAIEAEEFVYFTNEKEDVTEQYAPGSGGVNAIGRLPFVYVNRDESELVPETDTDIYQMTILLCVLLTDINFAHMFQSFAIMYGINVSDQGLKFAPNAFWAFKSEPGSDQKPEVGTIKAEADISAGLELVANQFALWLNSKGIKPGAVGEVNGQNFASGIAKMLDEMDTSEDRAEQVPFFQDAEAELWDLIMHDFHPYWSTLGIEMSDSFSNSATVVANFAEQVPLVRRAAVVEEQQKERDAGFTTRRRSLKRLNPQMSETEIDELEAAIDEARADGVNPMNGAQLSGLIELFAAVGEGKVPADAAVEVIVNGFGLTREAAEAMVKPLKTAENAKPEVDPNAPPPPPVPPADDDEDDDDAKGGAA